jgi:Outer membrane protein beta-barrel domain
MSFIFIKKIYVITSITLSLPGSTAFAQQRFEFGLSYFLQKTELVNSADYKAGTELDPASSMSYLGGGITASYLLNRHLAVEVDVLASRQGQIYTGTNMLQPNGKAYNSQVAFQAFLNDQVFVGQYQAKAELNCIKVPFLLKLTSDNRKRMYGSVSFGPQINVIKSVIFELNKMDISLPRTNINPEDVYRKTTVDGVLALGWNYKLCKHFSLSVQGRFDYGFQDVEKKDATYSYMALPEQKYYNSDRPATHNVTAGLMFGITCRL